MTRPASIRVLTAQAAREEAETIAFNFEDIRSRCDQYLRETREAAAKIKADAEASVQNVRQTALEKGRAEGLAAGMQEAQKKIAEQARQMATQMVQEQVRTLQPAVDAAVAQVNLELLRCLDRWQRDGVTLAAAIAGKLLHRELISHPDAGFELLRDVLQLTVGETQVRVELHPADLAVWETAGRSPENCQFVANAELTRGGCHVTTTQGVIDARIETLLQRIVDELAGPVEDSEA